MSVAVERTGGVLRLVLDRPERRNALDPAGVAALVRTLEEAATDEDLRAVLIASSGPDFCAGGDWVGTNRAADRDGGPRPRAGAIQRRLPLQAHRLIQLVTEIQLPVVCAVRGWAAGLGFQLALAADFTVAGDTATFWEPFVDRGFSPDSGATWLLPRLVGVARAKELLLLGRKISAREAADWGLILRAVPDGELESETEAVVAQLAEGPTVALGLAKRCLNRNLETGLVEAMEAEAVGLELASRTLDFKEGLAAFVEKRAPRFGGR